MLRVLVVLFVIAVAVYLTTRALERRAGGTRPGVPHPSERGRAPAPRQVAPDDDPDFLANLDWERRRNKARPESPQPPVTDPAPKDAADPAGTSQASTAGAGEAPGGSESNEAGEGTVESNEDSPSDHKPE